MTISKSRILFVFAAVSLGACFTLRPQQDAAVDSAAAAADSAIEDDRPNVTDSMSPATCEPRFHRVGTSCVADGGVRPVAPASMGDTALLRPTLRVALPVGADGAVVELCRDRLCRNILETVRVTGDSARPSASLPASTVVFWRARARVGAIDDVSSNSGPTWLFHTPAAGNSGGIDTSGRSHLDLNGDGLDDIAIGSPLADPGGRTEAGSVSVYYAGPSGVSAAPARILEGANSGDNFGRWVAGAGDVNGDGFGDIVVGAPLADPAGRIDAGSVSVFYGSSGGVVPTAVLVLEGVAADDRFGYSAAGAGDVNGDGFADVIVGAFFADPRGRTDAGSASLFLGGSDGLGVTAAQVLLGNNVGDEFGVAVAGAGDLNGDGFADVAVGAHNDPGGRVSAGTVHVFHGGRVGLTMSPVRVLEGVGANDLFGTSVASAGDVNNDGFADLACAAYHAAPGGRADAGTVSIFHGSAAGVVASASRTLEGVSSQDYFGGSVAGAGDVNGDGFADLVVGAFEADPGGRNNAGTVSVYLGSSAGIGAIAARVLEGAATGDYFGAAVTSGDLNGDGFSDIVVGAMFSDPANRMNAGAASVFLGSGAGVASVASRVLEGAAPQDNFGRSVAQVEAVGDETVFRRRPSRRACRALGSLLRQSPPI